MAIRRMREDDIPFVVKSTLEEGWGYTRVDLERMLRLNPEGSLVWEDRTTLGFITSVRHGNTAMIGHLVVTKEGRGRKIGGSLVKALLESYDSEGVESTMLYATDSGRGLYEKLGFEDKHLMQPIALYFSSKDISVLPGHCPRLTAADLPRVASIDRELFGDDRSKLLNHLNAQFPDHCFKLERDGVLTGYAFGRRTPIGFDIGPWASLSGEVGDARDLLESTVRSLRPGRVDLGIFVANSAISAMLRSYREYRREHEVRLMCRGAPRYPDPLRGQFGVCGFELS
jgi:GNAT superfamily N-acetyltransferase